MLHQDLRLHSHYKCQSSYTTPYKAGNSSAGGQKGSFGLSELPIWHKHEKWCLKNYHLTKI
jgi:hypothetical protein